MLMILIMQLTMAHASFWSDFCERHLIADDPYQYESFTVEQLVKAYMTQPPSSALDREIAKRKKGHLTDAEREMLKAII